jgi:hypothetical protein
MWMRSSLVVRASDCQCTSCNGPGFDPSIRRHRGIWGAADEAVLNIVRKKEKKSPKKIFKKKNSMLTMCKKVFWPLYQFYKGKVTGIYEHLSPFISSALVQGSLYEAASSYQPLYEVGRRDKRPLWASQTLIGHISPRQGLLQHFVVKEIFVIQYDIHIRCIRYEQFAHWGTYILDNIRVHFFFCILVWQFLLEVH